ncbi:CASP-like protein 4D1 [Benincasa hispida]|uniref:CASP-like protein 4D1 n=1 Tax=Benincasa hispida TaxID=102211 RepID=UPI0019020E96|nr:CASP-like protein 4D1 [Benincasa hispida]
MASKGSRIASLILRILTFILIFVALLIIATNSKTVLEGTVNETKIEFKDVNSYRYLVAVAVIGGALSLLQIAFTIYHLVTKGDGTPLFDLFSDKLLSYLLLSGASAGLGAGIDMRVNFKELVGNFFNSFFDKGSAAAAILLLAFICAAIVSILSSLALIRKP